MKPKRKRHHSWTMPLVFVPFCFDTLCLLLAAADYLLCEVDWFLLVLIMAPVGLVALGVGLVFTVYALFHLRQLHWRAVALWGLGLAAFVCIVFGLLPPGSKRVPAKMERYYLRNQTAMTSIASTLYASMPDSTRLVVESSGAVTLSPICGEDDYWGYPIVADKASLQPLPASFPKDSIVGLMKQIHCRKVQVYKPAALALFDYITSGFGQYWFELTLVPFSSEQMQCQQHMYNALPYSPQVCFRYHGGATDGDAPFPYKDDFLRRATRRATHH